MSIGETMASRSIEIPDELLAIRDRIDAVDSELVPLLATRLRLVVSAAACKSDRESVGDPARVDEVLERVRARSLDCGIEPTPLEAIFRVIIDEGIALETAAYDERLTGGTEAESPHESPAIEPAGMESPTIESSGAASLATAGNLMDVMATMRAMRRLEDRPVPRALLEKLIQAASWAPVGGNIQDYRFLIVTDRSQLVRLSPHWAKAMEFYLEALRPSIAPAELAQFERVRAAMAYQCRHLSRVPALIVVCREPGSFWRRLLIRPRNAFRALSALGPLDRLRVLANLRRWASRASAASVYPAVENLLLAARAHGLGATLTTWHSAFEGDFKAVLEIPRAVDVYAIVPVGYPLGNFGPVRRRPIDQLVDYERWKG